MGNEQWDQVVQFVFDNWMLNGPKQKILNNDAAHRYQVSYVEQQYIQFSTKVADS